MRYQMQLHIASCKAAVKQIRQIVMGCKDSLTDMLSITATMVAIDRGSTAGA